MVTSSDQPKSPYQRQNSPRSFVGCLIFLLVGFLVLVLIASNARLLIGWCIRQVLGDFALGPGHSDINAVLIGNYFLIETPRGDVNVSLLDRDPSTPMEPSTVIIPPMVTKVTHDDRFVIAEQQHLRLQNSNPLDFPEVVPGKFSYWILDTRIPKVFGPFNPEEFPEKRKELGVNPTLKLRGTNEFRSHGSNSR